MVSSLAVVDRHGDGHALRARLLEMLEAGNEADGLYRTTSPYLIATVR